MTMQCNDCGKTTTVDRRFDTQPHRRTVDAAMGVMTRRRLCGCGVEFRTVEMRQEELAELRRKAYLYELSQAKVAA